MPGKNVFYGASVTSRSLPEANDIIRRAKHLSLFLNQQGYQCHPSVVMDSHLYRDSPNSVQGIPEKYTKLATSEQVDEMTLRRLSGNTPLKGELASFYWGVDSLKEAVFCLWDLTFPSTGAGFELATALAMEKKCLCFSEGSPISSTVNGNPSPLLITAQYDEKFEQQLLSFIAS